MVCAKHLWFINNNMKRILMVDATLLKCLTIPDKEMLHGEIKLGDQIRNHAGNSIVMNNFDN